jgi:hypothetical protein
MKKDEITNVEITEKPRKRSSQWSVPDALSEEELDQLKKDSIDAFDKWTWETGSDEDKEKYKQLEKKLKKEEGIAEIQNEIDEIMTKLSNDIRETIDDDILTGLRKSSLDNTTKI